MMPQALKLTHGDRLPSRIGKYFYWGFRSMRARREDNYPRAKLAAYSVICRTLYPGAIRQFQPRPGAGFAQ